MPKIIMSALLMWLPLQQYYGEKLMLEETTPVASINEHPERFEGQLVRIAGNVVEVCGMKGCWIEIEDKAKDRIRVKVDDGVIVFPQTANGNEAIAEGTVELIAMTKDQYTSWLAHLAEETGRTFDPASVGEPPYRIVRLRGSGARITE